MTRVPCNQLFELELFCGYQRSAISFRLRRRSLRILFLIPVFGEFRWSFLSLFSPDSLGRADLPCWRRRQSGRADKVVVGAVAGWYRVEVGWLWRWWGGVEVGGGRVALCWQCIGSMLALCYSKLCKCGLYIWWNVCIILPSFLCYYQSCISGKRKSLATVYWQSMTAYFTHR